LAGGRREGGLYRWRRFAQAWNGPGPQGFRAADSRSEVALRISATAEGFVRLARGDEDPDRLFFERQLLMEGDTELGLVLNNTLDAIGPLWSASRPAT